MVFYVDSLTDFNYSALLQNGLLKNSNMDVNSPTNDISKLPNEFYMHIKVFSQMFTFVIKINKPPKRN